MLPLELKPTKRRVSIVTDRERLIEICQKCAEERMASTYPKTNFFEYVADYLLANGVTFKDKESEQV